MSGVFLVSDCSNQILSDDVWQESDDYGLFHFTPVRLLSDKALFVDCTFADVRINHLTSWGAPVPSTFQLFFADLMNLLIPPGLILVLNVVDTLSEEYLDESELVKSFLVPNNLEYFHLRKIVNGKEVPTLFFECPVNKLSILENIAFPGNATDIDGFVLRREYTKLFHEWVKIGNTDVMFRQLLVTIQFGFGIWSDQNGMFLATDKFRIPELAKTLSENKLVEEVRGYIAQY